MGRLAEQQRKLLEQLMGAGVPALPSVTCAAAAGLVSHALGIVQHDISLYDPKLCHPFVAGICPHDLFTNTKMDLGPCAKTHSIKLKNEYEELVKKAEAEKDEKQLHMLNTFKANYEQVIFGFVEECNRRIAAAQRRLEKTPEENNRTTALVSRFGLAYSSGTELTESFPLQMREVGEIEGAYQAAMAEVEQLGSQGKVEESMTQLTKAEALKAEKQEKERELQQLTETAGASGHQKLRVCDICGAYLSILDSDRRLADHFGGKMHLGYHQLRQLMDEWRARGPLQTAPLPAVGTTSSSANGAANGHSAPVAAPAVAFRPIPPEKRLRPSKEPSESGSGRGGSDRDRDRASGSRRDDYRSSRDDHRPSDRSSRAGAGEDYRSSRDPRDDHRDRTDRHRDADRRSSRRDDEGRRRTDEDDRRRSSRYDDDRRSSTRRAHEDGDERAAEHDKRRRVEA
ncbi:SPOSA6832_01311, partial [Sporobolomyces salmonicolor]